MPIPSAPPLNLSNPSVGAAEGYASSASSAYSAGLHFATALRAAAQQQQQQQDQQRQQMFQDQLKMRQAGGTPAPEYTTTSTGPDGLKTRESSAPPDDPTHMQQTPWGDRWHMPDDAERKAEKTPPLDDTNSVVPTGGLGEALEKHAGWKSGQRITPGNLHLLMESINLGTPKEDPTEFFHTTDQDATTHVYQINKKTGEVKEAGNFPGSGKGTADRPDATQLVGGYDQPMVFNKSTQTLSPVAMPPGVHRVATPAQEERQSRFEIAERDRKDKSAQAEADRQQRIADTFQAKHDQIYGDEQAQWALKQRYFDAANPPEGQASVIDPKSGQEVQPTPARRKAYMALADQAEKKAQDLQKQSKGIRQRFGWGEFGQGAQGASTAPPAQQKAAAPAKKLADPEAALKYLQKAGGDKTKARKLAKADGWEEF